MSERSKDRIHGAGSWRPSAVPRVVEGPIAFDRLIHINRSRPLLELVRHAERLARLDHAVSARLPPGLRGHCTVANVRAATLVMNASSPVWAARLRFMAPELLHFVRRHCAEEGMQSVCVRVSRDLRSAVPGNPRP